MIRSIVSKQKIPKLKSAHTPSQKENCLKSLKSSPSLYSICTYHTYIRHSMEGGNQVRANSCKNSVLFLSLSLHISVETIDLYIRKDRKLDPAHLPGLSVIFQQLLPPHCICAHTSDSKAEVSGPGGSGCRYAS